MNTQQLIATLNHAYAAKRPILVRSAPGIGKSASMLASAGFLAGSLGLLGVAQWGTELVTPAQWFGYTDVRLSQCDPVDVGGLPYADDERGTQRRMVPDWFPSTDRTDLPEFGYLVLEEIVSATPAVQAAAYQLTLDRRIGDKVMKEGWQILLTGNRLSDGGVVYKLPTPLANRLIHLTVETDATVWRQWAIDAGIDNSLVAYIALRPDMLNTFEEHVTKKQKGDAFATERSWHIANDIIVTSPPEDVMFSLVTGAVGAGPAADYIGFRAIWQNMPSIDHILLDPKGAPVPSDVATQYAVATALAARATKDNVDNVLTYADRFRHERSAAEITALCVKDVMRRTPQCASTAAFNMWAARNADMLS